MDTRRLGFKEPERAAEDDGLELTLGLSIGRSAVSRRASASPKRSCALAWSCSADARADLDAQAARSRARDREAKEDDRGQLPRSRNPHPCSLSYNAAQNPSFFTNWGPLETPAVPGVVPVHVPYGNGYGFSWVVPMPFWQAVPPAPLVIPNGFVDGCRGSRTVGKDDAVGMVSPGSGCSGISDPQRRAEIRGENKISRSTSSSCETKSNLTRTMPEEPQLPFSSQAGRSDDSITSHRSASPPPKPLPEAIKVGDVNTAKNNGDKKPDVLPRMPCVSATGNGPNGRTISGLLHRYSKTEVSIVCSCHGSSFSPAEFVEHAGGVAGSHPLKQIVVVSS